MSHQWVVIGDTITETMHTAVRAMLDHPTPSAVLNIESHMYNTLLIAKGSQYALDVGRELWLNRSRWSRLIKEYVPADGLNRLIAQAHEILCGEARQGATANIMFRDPERYMKKHRWGGCLMGATFRGGPEDQPTLTFYSRTTYIGYMGMLDAAVAAVLAREITNGLNGIGPQHIQFRWHISSAQLHCFKTLPFIYSQPDLIQKLEKYEALVRKQGKAAKAKMPPTWYHMALWYKKVLDAWNEHGVDMLEHEKYGPFKRIKRRWLEYKGHLAKHIPPSVKVDSLDFSKAE